jgi:hypothetical protein
MFAARPVSQSQMGINVALQQPRGLCITRVATPTTEVKANPFSTKTIYKDGPFDKWVCLVVTCRRLVTGLYALVMKSAVPSNGEQSEALAALLSCLLHMPVTSQALHQNLL